MKIKTSELSGVALDWAVAQAAEEEIHHEYIEHEQRKMLVSKWQDYSRDGDFNQQEEWSPSTDWSQGGPLIERFSISIVKEGEIAFYACSEIEVGDCWHIGGQQYGDTYLIAACRAIVAAKLGDEVDVPEGLV